MSLMALFYLLGSKLKSFDATWPEHTGLTIFLIKERKEKTATLRLCYSCLHGLNAPAVFNKDWFQWLKPKPGSNTLIGQEYFLYSPCASTTVWLSEVIVYSLPSLALILQTTFNKCNTGRHALHYPKKKRTSDN